MQYRNISCDIIKIGMSRVCKVHQRLDKKRQNENTMLLKVRDKLLVEVE